MNKDTICVYPFSSIAIKEYRDGKLNSFWPCCTMGNFTLEELDKTKEDPDYLRTQRISAKLPFTEDISELSPMDLFNHPSTEQLRQDLLNGVRNKACTVCWEMEDRNINSFRQEGNKGFDNLEEIIQTNKLRTIDMSINNSCNLRCRMCSPSASSALMIDHEYFKKNGLEVRLQQSVERWAPAKSGAFKLKTNKQWQWIVNNTDKFDVLRLSGGEPFYNDGVIEFIDAAIASGQAKNIMLEFHTNATLFDAELCNKLKQFKNNFNCSIDGYGKVYEYVRYPATWNQLDTSLRTYIDIVQPRHLHIPIIMMIFNVFNLPEFIKWADSLDTEPLIDYAEVHSQTRGISLINLSKELLQEARAEILAASAAHPRIDVSNAINIIDDAIKNNVGDKHKAREELVLFDLSRNQNFEDYLDPRVVQWLNS